MNPFYKYYSNAKFLLTGEYLVLQGALALAVPLQFGQTLEVSRAEKSGLEWQAYERNQEWLHFTISLSEIENQKEKGKTEKDFVCFLLNRARCLEPSFLQDASLLVRTKIDFDRNWGLGSSSSLINNVAHWANVNPYELHALVSNGSGYDIACANYCQSILFRQNNNYPLVYPVDFSPPFSEQIYFVYLGQKQKSEQSVHKFLSKNEHTSKHLGYISSLTKKILQVTSSKEFDLLVAEHEHLISEIIGEQTVKQKHFSDFKGSVKSLGAWGGDFVMVRSDLKREDLESYFGVKALNTVFSWNEIVLGKNKTLTMK